MDRCVQDVGEMNWGSIVQMLRKPIQLLVLQQHEGGAACKALGREWVDSAFFFAKDLDLQPMALYYFVVAPTISWMLKRKKHRSFDVFNMAMMCSWERLKRVTLLHLRNMYLQKNTSIYLRQRLIVEKAMFFHPKISPNPHLTPLQNYATIETYPTDHSVQRCFSLFWEWKFDLVYTTSTGR